MTVKCAACAPSCALLTAQRCSSEFIEDVVLALQEAMVNVVRHEYAGDERGRMSLRVDRDGNALIFRLADYAAQVDCNSLRSRSLDELRPGGLGVHVIGSIMDQWQFVPPAGGEGNVLEMVKNVTNGNRGDSR